MSNLAAISGTRAPSISSDDVGRSSIASAGSSSSQRRALHGKSVLPTPGADGLSRYGQRRPDTASTVASNASFASAADGSLAGSDFSVSTATRLGAGLSGHAQLVPSRSSTSSSSGTTTTGQRTGKTFEQLLASDETYKLSSDFDTQDTMIPATRNEHAAEAGLEDDASPRYPGTRRRAGTDQDDRQYASHAKTFFGGAGKGSTAISATHDRNAPRNPSASYYGRGQNSSDSLGGRTPTLDQTPRLNQSSFASGSATPVVSPRENAHTPARPPRNIERNLSTSTRASAASGKYATPPSGGASPVASAAELSTSSLPVHPLAGSVKSSSANAALRNAAALTPTSRGKAATSRPAVMPDAESDAKYDLNVLAVSALPPATSGGVALLSPTGGKALTPAVPFPRSSSRGDAAVPTRPALSSANTAPASWTTTAFPTSPSSSGMGLEHELGLGSPGHNGSDKPSGTFLSQRLKKTSGFLKKLRGDKDAKGEAKHAANAVSTASPPPSLSVEPHASLQRRASNSSFVSDGAASQAPSTKSVPTSRTDYARSGTNYAEEPVPSVPAKWVRQQSSVSRGARGFSARMSKNQKKDKPNPIGVGIGAAPLPVAKDAINTRSGSAPIASAGPPLAHLQINQRSTSHGTAQDLESSSTQGHRRKVGSNVGGSSSSGSEMRHTLKAWETQMDETLADAAKDLDTKTKIAAPLASWTPSPVLPDLQGIDGRKGRSGSFMGDEDETKAWSHSESTESSLVDQRGHNASTLIGTKTDLTTPRVVDTPEGWARLQPGFKRSPVPLLGKRNVGNVSPGRSSLEVPPSDATASQMQSRNRNASAPGWTHEVDDGPLGPSQDRATSSNGADESAGEKQILGHAKRSDNVSSQSAKSFETAVDPGSLFFRRADLQAKANAALAASSEPPLPRSPLLDGAVAAAATSAADADESTDPERSIRVVPQNENYDEPTTPTETEVNTRAKRTHAREVSDLGPLPTSTLNVGTIGRRPGRASPSATPVGKAAQLLTDSTSTKSPRRSASSNVSVTAPDEADPAVDVEAQAKRLAEACWDEDDGVIKREKIAESLGGLGLVKSTARGLYMSNFDFTGLRVDDAFRKLCDKLFLRAETQQVDRILFAFSERFWACNPLPLYMNADVVHSLVFSLLLLNTDLHVADIVDRMTRNQFVRNTLSAISESARIDTSNTTGSPFAADDSRSSLSVVIDGSATGATSLDTSSSTNLKRKPSKGASSVKSAGYHAAATGSSTHVNSSGEQTISKHPPSSSGAAQSIGKKSLEVTSGARSRAWEVELEGLLKEIYASIKSEQIRLPTAENKDALSPMLHGAQRRTLRGGSALNVGSERISVLKRGSIRGIQGLLGTSSSTLLRSDDNLSLTPSSFGSRSFAESGLTPASSALSSPTSQLAVPGGAVDRAAPLTLGFANTLSHSIVKEANDEDDAASDASLKDDELSDEELALMGPPWAKEGMLTRKHYWEGPQRRAKDKNWLEVFVVVQKGLFSVFRFGTVSGAASKAATAVGGGNWLSNATPLGDFSLAHTLANALPPPGYNRARPHVFALTLPSGAVYFYQAGHEELVQEWVSTCNYWAARQSREPLGGAVGNMEYGWNKVLPRSEYDFDDDTSAEAATLEEEPRESLAPSADGRASHAGSSGSLDSPGRSQMPARVGSAPPDASIYATLTASSRSKVAASSASAMASAGDNRSIRSGRSGRSGRGRVGGTLFQNWTDAAASLAPGSNTVSPSLSGKGASGGSSVFSSGATPGVHANERIYINHWQPPSAPTTQSTLKEEEQLDACLHRVSTIEKELEEHNALREPMSLLYSPKGNNHAKALQNWQAKSQWLLAELTKFQVYVESLRSAAKLRAEKSAARAVETMMKRADAVNRTRPEEEGGPVASSA